MTVALAQHPAKLDDATMLLVVAGGDCSRLTPDQKLAYYNARCEAAGLDPRAQPFAFMKLNGKEVLYALKAATDQLASKHGIRAEIVSQATEDGIRIVTVRATAKDGRQTDEIGAVTVKGLVGDALCNALMKAVTKAKRRAVLSLAGLGLMDETEVETIPAAALDGEVVQAATRLPAPAVEPPKPPAVPPPPPAYVVALWAQCKKEFGRDAKGKWENAALGVFGENAKPSNLWTPEDHDLMEKALFPQDVPF